MKKLNILVISALAALTLAACNAPSSSQASSEASSSQASSSSQTSSSSAPKSDYLFYQLKEGQTKDGLEGAPWVNSVKEGIGKKLVKPSEKDDFYLNRTYELQNTAVLEPGDIAIGGMPGAIKTISKRTSKMLSETTSSTYSKALTDVYKLYSKVDKSTDEGYVKAQIDEIKAISSVAGLVEYLVNKGYDSVWPLFELLRTAQDQLVLKEENMGLTPSSINFSYLDGNEEEKQRVINTTVYLLGLYGYNEAEAKSLLQKATEAYRDATEGGSSIDNTTVGEIDEQYPGLRLKEYFSTKLGYAQTDKIMVASNISRLLKALSDLVTGTQETATLTLEGIKDILILRAGFISVISRNLTGDNGYMTLTQGLDSNTQGYNEDMFLKDIFGSRFRDVYDRVYIDNFETKERRASIVALMEQVAGEYKNLLRGSTWLDESTRNAAVEKLDAMTFDACYPVSLESLPAWNLNASSFMESVNAYSAWSRKANQPVNEKASLWGATITTVNGVYNPLSNSFVIFDGLLASESYTANMAKEELYGSIGTVIGHEISHAFDVQGSKYDKHGMQTDWWTDKDKTAYAAKVDKIKAVWSTYENKPNMKLDCSDGMLGEIIADMGGVSVCLRLGAKLNSFDYAKFFTAYANMHGSIMSEAILENLIYGGLTGKQDSHPIGVFRVNGVVNQFEKFYQTFDVKENDKMYVAPANRLNIWG